MERIEIETPRGLAAAYLERRPPPAPAALVLGHGAGGGIEARDIVASAAVAARLGLAIVRVEQPYRVAGRRAPAPAKHLDDAWLAVMATLKQEHLSGMAIVTGGRSLGARVACRTAAEVGAVAVLCLAFPLRPPRRKGKPEPPSRLPELEAVKIPALVIQGTGDPFGMPPPGPGREVVEIAGNHSLTSDLDAVADAVETWLPTVLPAP